MTGAFTSRADFKEGDIRAQHHTKMSEENFDKVLPAKMLQCGTKHRLLAGASASCSLRSRHPAIKTCIAVNVQAARPRTANQT